MTTTEAACLHCPFGMSCQRGMQVRKCKTVKCALWVKRTDDNGYCSLNKPIVRPE